ncbi:MAG: hypothetical protein KDC98_19010 [Planctomycetes bacterium]|nr:hypothetical protein [Planctomycetota bacterium]
MRLPTGADRLAAPVAGGTLPHALAPYGLPGCQLLVEPLVGRPIANPGGAAGWSLALPGDAGLIGVQFFHQAFTLDAGAVGGVAVSAGGDATIGAK